MTIDLDTLHDHDEKSLHEFFDFLRFPSISSDPAFANDMRMCVEWLKTRLEELPLKVELWQAEGPPVLFASYMGAGSDAPTVLIYNHYDVQPVDPLEAWQSPPFSPQVRHGEIYARGAQDNKGQCFFVLEALRMLFKQHNMLPVNLKWIIEGEEEIGSRHLPALLESKREALAADYLLIADVGIAGLDKPSVTLGVRGIATMEIILRGSSGDLHSGIHGGIVYNPLHAIVEMLSSLRDPQTGRIMVPGFYDAALPANPELLADSVSQFSAERYALDFAAEPTGGEKEFPPLARAWLRPTIEINGINGGYSGIGFKTVIPAVATAKLSARLVPKQDPAAIAESIRQFLLARVPAGIDAIVNILPGVGEAVRADPHSPLVKAFVASYEKVFATPCACCLDGGSIPITAILERISGAAVLLVGLGLPTDHIHAPNEHFGVQRLKQGTLMIAEGLIHLRHEHGA